MGIVERLRSERWLSDQTRDVVAMVHEAADIITRLKGYADHTPYCQSRIKGLHENPCTCGLTALIKEIEGD